MVKKKRDLEKRLERKGRVLRDAPLSESPHFQDPDTYDPMDGRRTVAVAAEPEGKPKEKGLPELSEDVTDWQNPEYWIKRYKLAPKESEYFKKLWEHDYSVSNVAISELGKAQHAFPVITRLDDKLEKADEGFSIKRFFGEREGDVLFYSMKRPIETFTPEEIKRYGSNPNLYAGLSQNLKEGLKKCSKTIQNP